MERHEETTTVKRAVISGGFGNNNVRVKHGTGTAWGWLKVYADIHHKPECTCYINEYGVRETSVDCAKWWRDVYDEIERIAIQASGRNKYEAECINVNLNFKDITL
jgi:hypothetical protein